MDDINADKHDEQFDIDFWRGYYDNLGDHGL